MIHEFPGGISPGFPGGEVSRVPFIIVRRLEDLVMAKRIDRVTVATPCTVDWNSMTGDDKIRFCGQCKLNVHNLSAMSEAEALKLMDASEGKLCVRFFKRA